MIDGLRAVEALCLESRMRPGYYFFLRCFGAPVLILVWTGDPVKNRALFARPVLPKPPKDPKTDKPPRRSARDAAAKAKSKAKAKANPEKRDAGDAPPAKKVKK